MNTKKILLSALLSCLFVSAWADEAAGQAGGGLATSGAAYADLLRGKVAKNAPYSAEGEQETQRSLPDGNQITTKVSTLYYRDSNGNTRQETRAANGEVQSIMIQTADNTNYNLMPAAKMAIKMSMDRISAKAAAVGTAAGRAIKARIEAERKDGKQAKAERKEDEEIVIKRAAANSDAYANALPLIAGAYSDMKWALKATTKDLGARDIGGIRAEGKLRSYEIPAGEVGNRNPIVVTDENWYSPELQVTLYSKHSDPRTGDAIFRLSNLKRGEQAASLFTVPSDYTVNDITAGPEKALGDMEAQWKKK